ncbi:sel1 repeat family protein [Terrimonas sp. NA20]|uniref:Sel1 repeat family protein n=1 Tax=Terrimonas ginsenosidimutans TaxID=2908004 RepID=A0ABS9L0Y2_9BACT|nr:tetratricopeptide repeat protein [Terrimonas ginsenosidimutans]MCG2618129.1 sel1 repeat family protein [Terrimonas ginsenosidimutans]
MKMLATALFLSCFSPIVLLAQENKFEGLWEGESKRGEDRFAIKMNVAFTGKTKWTDTDVLTFAGTTDIVAHIKDNTPYITPGDRLFGKIAKGIKGKPKAELFFHMSQLLKDTATNSLFYTEAVYLDGDEKAWCLKQFLMTYSKTADGEFLTGVSNDCGKLEIKLKRTETVVSSSEKAKVIKVRDNLAAGVKITDIKFVGADGSREIRSNQTGTFSYRVINNSSYALKGIFCGINIYGEFAPLIKFVHQGQEYQGGIAESFDIPKGGSVEVSRQTRTSLEVPPDSVVFVSDLGRIGAIVWHASTSIRSQSMFANVNFTIPDKTDPRTVALDLLFGTPTFDEPRGRQKLDQLAKSGDKKAIMWQSFFTYAGLYSYPKNEELAMHRARKAEVFNVLLPLAKTGDLEAMYLIAYAYSMKLNPGQQQINADYFLKTAATNHYKPAAYDFALRAAAGKDTASSRTLLGDLYRQGFKRAGFSLAMLNERSITQTGMADSAVAMYKSLSATGNVDAMIQLAELTYAGKAVRQNKTEGLAMAKKAAGLKNTTAMVSYANLLMKEDVNDLRRKEAIQLLTQAGDYGDREAMFVLGLLHYNAAPADKKTAATWIERAAIQGHPQAMHLAGNFYGAGEGVEKNSTKSRYWLNQAKSHGVGKGSKGGEAVRESPFLILLQGALNYEPSTYEIVRNQYGNVVSEGYIDNQPMNYMLGGLGELFRHSQSQKQEIINDIQEIKNDSVSQVLGGIIMSGVKIPDILAGQMINVSAGGSIGLGTIAGIVNTYGTNDQLLRSFSFDPQLNHGAVIMQFNDSPFQMVGPGFTGWKAPAAGTLLIGVNDRQYQNNTGYFDLRIEIFKN